MRQSIAIKTFLFSFLLVTLVLVLTLSILYFAMPEQYLQTKSKTLQSNTYTLAQSLQEAKSEDECAELIAAFSEKNNAKVYAYESEGVIIPTLSTPFVSMAVSAERVMMPDNSAVADEIRIVENLETAAANDETYVYTEPAILTDLYSDAYTATIMEDRPFYISIVRDLESAEGTVQSSGSANAQFVRIQMVSEQEQGSSIAAKEMVGTNLIDSIETSSTLQPIDESKDVILSLMPGLLLLGVVISLMLSYWFSRKLTKPILQISGAAVKMQDMDPDARSNVRTGDELGALSENLDALYEKLQSNIHSLQAEMERASQLERSKTQFMQSAGHELKTPIAALGGVLEGMIDNVGVYKDRDQYLLESKALVDRLSSLVGEILQSSKSDLPQEALNIEEIGMQALMDEVLDTQTLFIREKGLLLTKEGLDFTVCADRGLLYQVVFNLVSNAVRYTGPGGEIFITAQQGEQGTRFSIENKCAPIPQDELEKLFEPFYTRSFSRDRTESGTGLGLYIVRKNLEALEFPLEIETTDLGLRLTILFPNE